MCDTIRSITVSEQHGKSLGRGVDGGTGQRQLANATSCRAYVSAHVRPARATSTGPCRLVNPFPVPRATCLERRGESAPIDRS